MNELECEKKPRGWFPFLVEVGIIACIILILGAMNIEMRVMIAAVVLLGSAIIAAVLCSFRVISRQTAKAIPLLSIPIMIVFWIGLEYVQDWRVVPTREYIEDEHWFPSYMQRSVKLEETPSLRLEPNKLSIDGATSLCDLYLSYASTVYGGQHFYNVKSSRTPQAYEKLIRGECDLIFAFRPSEAQIAAATAAGKELRITPIGYDAFVFFVNADNPVNALTIRQLKDIYSGKSTNWRDASGDNAAIIPFQRYEGSGSQSRMERFMAGETLLTPEKEHRFRYMRGIVTHVARYKNYRYAIGYSYLYYVNVMMEGGGVKLLSVEGVPPDARTLRDGTYPLAEEICIVTAGSKKPETEQFIDWVLSTQGQVMLETIGFVPLRPVADGRGKPKARLVAGRREGFAPRHMELRLH